MSGQILPRECEEIEHQPGRVFCCAKLDGKEHWYQLNDDATAEIEAPAGKNEIMKKLLCAAMALLLAFAGFALAEESVAEELLAKFELVGKLRSGCFVVQPDGKEHRYQLDNGAAAEIEAPTGEE